MVVKIELPVDANGRAVPVLWVRNVQDLADTNVSTALNSPIVRVVAKDAGLTIEFGEAPDGTGDLIYLPQNDVEYFKITPGYKVKVAGGSIQVGECY